MGEQNIPEGIFSGGINWDSREPLPPEADQMVAGTSTRDVHPHSPVAHYTPSNSSDSRHPSPPGDRHDNLNSAGGRAGQGSEPDTTRDPSSLQKARPWGLQEPPSTASIFFLDKSSQTRKHAVSEFGCCVLTPLSVEITVFVVHNTAKMTVTHFFYNDSAEPIDKAAYAFPIPVGCTLTDFSYRIGDHRTVSAVVEPAAQAREKFTKAVAEMRTAVLLEQDRDSAEIIMAQLGNIPGKTEIKTEFELVLLLERRIDLSEGTPASITTLTIPAAMASRYGASVPEVNEAPSRMPEGVSIKVDVMQSPGLQNLTLQSPSHNIDPQMRPRNQKAQSLSDLQSSTSANQSDGHSMLEVLLEDKERLLDKDFVLEIRSKSDAEGPRPQAWLGQHSDPNLPKQHALMVHIPPLALSSANRSKDGEANGELVFLLDQSNSMDDKIGPLLKATKFFLQNIPRGWKFNICLFGSTYKSLWPSSRERQDTHLNEALEWLQKNCQGNRGGTEVISALKAVLKNISCPTQVLLITDGQVWRLDQTLELIENTRQESRHPIRFFCLGIGDMTPRALAEGVANSGGGYSDVIYFKDPRWGEKLVAMLAFILAVHTKPIQVLLNGTITPDPALQSPGILSRLNVLQEENIFLLVDSHLTQDIKSVIVSFASNDGEETEIDIPVQVLDKLEKNDTIIHKLAARALLNDLRFERSKFHTEPDGPDQARIKKWAEKMACEWKLLSEWTSFIMPEQPGKDRDGPLVPPKSGSALMQTRLLTKPPKMASHLIEAPVRSTEDENTRADQEMTARLEADARRRNDDIRREIESEAAEAYDFAARRSTIWGQGDRRREEGIRRREEDILRGEEELRRVRQLREPEDELRRRAADSRRQEHDSRRSEANSRRWEDDMREERRRLEEIRRREEDSLRLEDEMRQREEESRRRGDGFRRWDDDARVRWAPPSGGWQEERERRRERDIRADDRMRDPAIRVPSYSMREQETRQEFHRGFRELTHMITELRDVLRRNEEDREAAIKKRELEERARREEEAHIRAELQREKRRLEREIREATEAESEPLQGEATPQTGRGANGRRAETQMVGKDRIWRLGVLTQDSIGQWKINRAMVRIGQLVSGDETQASGSPQVLAILTVAGMAALAVTLFFFFVTGFMFLSSWIIALWILRI